MNRSRNKWIEYGQSQQEGESDLSEKFRTIYILHDHFGLYGLTGETVFIPSKGWPNFPDIFIPAHKPQIAIDLHGDAPFHSGGRRDQQRVEEYKEAGVQYIIIWEVLTKYDANNIILALEEAGLKPVA